MRGTNYNHLYYFWVVANEGSIARASAILHLTPQTISSQIHALEDSFGAKLFSRAGRNLVLTDTGRVALAYADDIFRLGAEMADVLAGRSHGQTLQFRVGIVDVVPKMIAYRLLEPALNLPEPARIVCNEGKLDNLLADLALHKLDMVLADTPMSGGAGVRAFNHLLGECGITFFAATRLAARCQTGFPDCLRQMPMLLPASNTALRGALMQWLEQAGIKPRITGEFEDSALMNAFGRAGVGVFIAPSLVAVELARQYEVEVIGETQQVRERFFAISTERRLRHPAIMAISNAARLEVFCQDGDR